MFPAFTTEGTMGFIGRRPIAAGLAGLFLLSGLLFLPGYATAPSVMHTTDADFIPDGTGGLLNRVVVNGTGVGASLELDKNEPWWNQVFPATPPSARTHFAMAYDEVNGETVLFGGYDGAFRGDTWRYNLAANTWTDVTPAGSPSSRWYHGMAYDSSQQVMVLYGGYNDTGGLHDTWEFDVTTDTWTEQTPGVDPGVLGGSPLAYDSRMKRTILAETNATSNLFETWAYDALANAWISLPATNPPSSRSGHTIGYLASRDRTVLYGGTDVGGGIHDETFEFSYGTLSWALTGAVLGPFNERTEVVMASRPASNDILMFGGLRGLTYFANTYRYDYDSGSAAWDELVPPDPPPERSSYGLAFDAAHNETVMFGGKNSGGKLADTWLLTMGSPVLGSYRSNRMDSLSYTTDWTRIWWNNTPATQPPGTQVKFRFSASNGTTPTAPMVGPDCQFNTFYTTPGQAICPTTWGRYGWYFAVFTTAAGPYTPVIQDVTLEWGLLNSPPFVTWRSPADVELGVSVNAAIQVEFSEAMDPATTTVETSPSAAFQPYLWTNGFTNLTAIPAVPLPQCTAFWVYVNGTDVDGFSLIPGIVPNPWLFSTECAAPFLVTTDPTDFDPGPVVATDPLLVYFSEDMDNTTVFYGITPNPGGLSAIWSNGDTVLTIDHNPFTNCTWYTANVTGESEFSQPLVYSPPGPGASNPFTFRTDCPNPEVLSHYPFAGMFGVPLTDDITVTFSKAMDTASVTIDTVPTLVNPVRAWNPPADDFVTVAHDPFLACTQYTVTVDGRDIGGTPMLAPVTWQFLTACTGPVIVSRFPNDGATDLPPTQDIFINFSAPMNLGSVVISVTSSIPPDPTFTNSWIFNSALRKTPVARYASCAILTVDVVSALDELGNPFTDPLGLEPFSFSITCPNPMVTATAPVAGASNVPLTQAITVDFSKPMDIGVTNTTIETSPPVALAPLVWSNGDMTVTANPLGPLPECTRYTVWANGTSAAGYPLIPGPVPNPFTFDTVCTSPQVMATSPVSGASGVPLASTIVVDLSEAMDILASGVETSPPTPFTPFVWSNGDARLTATPSTPLLPCITYTVWMNGTDVAGNPLTAGPVPNPWTFDTVCVLPPPAAPPNLVVQRSGIANADVRLDWGDVPGAGSYRVYTSPDRFAAFPSLWTIRGTTLLSEFTASGDGADTLTHYYIVRSVSTDGSSESGNSTMGVKTSLSFTKDPLRTNVHWFSLPYVSGYSKASDIAAELTSSNVDVIAKWDAATQRTVAYLFARGQWRGTDFPIGPGDGLYVNAVQTFRWVVTGTDVSHLLSFTLNPPPLRNRVWIGLPYTSVYRRASEVVAALEPGLGNTRISEVGLWDPLTQTEVRYFFSGGVWQGTDFVIAPGAGTYLVITSSFTWTPVLLTPTVP